MKKFILGFILGALIFSSIAVIATNGAQLIEVAYRDIQIEIDGQKVTTDVEPFIYQGRTYVPVRFVAENLNMNASWDETNSTVELTSTVAGKKITSGTFMNNYSSITVSDAVYLSLEDILQNKQDFQNNVLQSSAMQPIYKAKTHDGMKAIQINGLWYVDAHEAHIRINSNVSYSDDGYIITFATKDGVMQASFDRRDSTQSYKNNQAWYYRYDMLVEIFAYVDAHPELKATPSKNTQVTKPTPTPLPWRIKTEDGLYAELIDGKYGVNLNSIRSHYTELGLFISRSHADPYVLIVFEIWDPDSNVIVDDIHAYYTVGNGYNVDYEHYRSVVLPLLLQYFSSE